MLATLVIGLREGLEAALIVGIIAAFLRRNGRSLVPMWIGVGLALALSVGVGVVLSVIEQALPQAAQEGMETVIGAVAIVFVTTMIVWMSTHARGLKKELEAEADHALHEGTSIALAIMAFLAVLKEGFETSVFLLATFQASTSAVFAGLGAVIGVLVSAGLGVGIYLGGVRLDLGRFFRITGVFLVLVAAGLVMTMLRTAHEAGWLDAGQQTTVDLTWLAPNGSVQAALITGVLGIPADPRLIEVVGWLAYLIPVGLYVLWPVKRRPRGAAVPRLQFGVAGALGAVAVMLAAVVAVSGAASPPPALSVVSANGTPLMTATVSVSGGTAIAHTVNADGTTGDIMLTHTADNPDGSSTYSKDLGVPPVIGSSFIELKQLTDYFGRVPVGIDPQRNPGPYDAKWGGTSSLTATVQSGVLVDLSTAMVPTVTLTGGGLTAPRTFTVGMDGLGNAPGTDDNLYTAPASRNANVAFAQWQAAAAPERALWGIALPVALAIAALLLAVAGIRSRRRLRLQAQPSLSPTLSGAPGYASTH